MAWKLESGASATSWGSTTFRVWAPNAQTVDVVVYHRSGPQEVRLSPEGDGLFSAEVPGVGHSDRYKFRLDGGHPVPDPYSRSQPLGVHGPSEIVDPGLFQWQDESWMGLSDAPHIIYECHVGTFTEPGTFAATIDHLPYLRDLGVTMLEIMPVAAFPGRWNWGYDGVDLFAPSQTYGGPDGLKQLVDAAHAIGIGVMLDVVYNHFGPDGNYLWTYSRDYFTDRYHTPWGEALNYDGEHSNRVRELVTSNACYWANEYHIDGLRLDAVHAIYDNSPVHILREIEEKVRESVPHGRKFSIVAEDSRNLTQLIDPADRGGFGLDGVWADDFHHSVRTLLTGEEHGYYADYRGTPDDIAKCLNEGFLYQGEESRFRRGPRGARVTDQPARQFVICIQNHDQIGNRPFGDRLDQATTLGQYLVASMLLLLAPETPLLFMGQEFVASSPFQYFTDHGSELGRLVTEGRRNEFAEFMSVAEAGGTGVVPDPQSPDTFLRSKLRHAEKTESPHSGVLRAYRDLIALRRSDPVFSLQDRIAVRASAVTDAVLALHGENDGQRRLVVANFGDKAKVVLDALPFGSMTGIKWSRIFSTADYATSRERAFTDSASAGKSIVIPTHTGVVLRGESV